MFGSVLLGSLPQHEAEVAVAGGGGGSLPDVVHPQGAEFRHEVDCGVVNGKANTGLLYPELYIERTLLSDDE